MLIKLLYRCILINIEYFYLKMIKRVTSNRNEYVLFFHYINNYCVENRDGKFYFGDRLHNTFKEYNVESKDKNSSSLELTENIKWNYKRLNAWNIANYEFNLPVDLKTVSRLRFDMDRKKYKFVYITWDKKVSITEPEDDYIQFHLLDKYGGKMNFLYYYSTTVRKIDNINLKELNFCSEFLINIDEEKANGVLKDLQEDIYLKGVNVIYKLMDNELDFFNRKEINKIYPFSNYIHSHVVHSFKTCKNGIEFEDYNILGDYIMRLPFAVEIDTFLYKNSEFLNLYMDTDSG
jgi:hypothetical protein